MNDGDVSKTTQARRQRRKNIQVLFRKEKDISQSEILYPAKDGTFRKRRQNNNDFSNIQKLREFIDSRPEIREMLREVFQVEGKLYQLDICDFTKEMKE